MKKIKDQKKPIKNSGKGMWDLVIKDMKDRDKVGQERYGTKLQSFNGRNSAVDLYQESLDMIVYCRQLIEEREEIVSFLFNIMKFSDNVALSGKAESLLRSMGEYD